MRALFAVAASALASTGAIVASFDAHPDFVPFFAGLAFAAAVAGVVAHEPFVGTRRLVARAATGVWVVAAVWVGALLVMALTVWQTSGPPPAAEQTFLGISATVYYLCALYGGSVLMILVNALPWPGIDGRGPWRRGADEPDHMARDQA